MFLIKNFLYYYKGETMHRKNCILFDLKLFFFLLLTIFISYSTYGITKQDSIIIKGNFIGNSKISKVTFNSYTQDSPLIVSNVSGNSFELLIFKDIEPGVYYIQYFNEESTNGQEENTKTNIIIDGIEKNISFELKLGSFFYHPFPVFQESLINIKWYAYLKQTQVRVERLQHLFDFFTKFPTQLDNKILRYYQKERRQFYKLFSEFIQNNSNNWAGLIVVNNPYYFSDLIKKPVIRDFLRQDYFWEGIDTNNPKLINSYLYKQHINNYLSYVEDVTKHYPFDELEKQKRYKKSSDIIIEKFSKNTQTNLFVKQVLFDFFSKKNNQELLDYLFSKYKN